MNSPFSRREILALMGVAGAMTSLLFTSDLIAFILNYKKEDNMNPNATDYEAIIVGGGPSGLTAAMTLGRLSCKALLCDNNQPRNAPSSHVNNFPTRDGIHPLEWRKHAQQNLSKYKTIKTVQDTVTSIEKTNGIFKVQFSSGANLTAKKVILAYGVKDQLPDIPGFKDLWGKSIFHCPFCHGYEARGMKLGFLIHNNMAFHALPMIADLASKLIIFTDDKIKLKEDEVNLLKNKNITLIEEKILGFKTDKEILHAVVLQSGTQIELEGLFFSQQLPFVHKSTIGESLGCEKNEWGFYKVNEMGKTSVEGVFACGDSISMAHSVLLASASGVTAGAGAIFELLNEKFKS